MHIHRTKEIENQCKICHPELVNKVKLPMKFWPANAQACKIIDQYVVRKEIHGGIYHFIYFLTSDGGCFSLPCDVVGSEVVYGKGFGPIKKENQ